MKNNSKRLAVYSGLAAAGVTAAGVIIYSTAKHLVEIALDREEPKISKKSHKKISGSNEKNEISEYLSSCEEKLKNSDLKTVETESHDKIRLIGHLYQCENAKRTVIAMHGWRSSWTKNFSAISDFWHSNNCNVLYAEQRGQGNSDGEYMGFGLMERYDCLDWVNYLNENGFSGLPIYLVGISMGAATVLMAADLDLPENVHGIIADCGYTSPYAIWKHVMSNNLHLPYVGIAGLIANDMCKKKIQIGSKDYSCTEALSKSNVPVLFIHGTDDRFVPIEMTYENYKACTAEKRLLVVPGAEHGKSYIVDKAAYETAIKNFWNDFD